jgi:hypothetical protein
MRSRLIVLVVVLLSSAALLYRQTAESQGQRTAEREPLVVKATAFAVSRRVDSIAPPAVKPRPDNGKDIPVRNINEEDEQGSDLNLDVSAHDADAAVASFISSPMPAPLASFDGLSNFDNIAPYNAFFIPPDTIGDVGPDHYVQAVNALIRVFRKDGSAETPPFKLSDLTTPLATPCATRNDGDPTVVYDPLADRWILSEFCMAFPPFRQMVAVSKTSDPAGQYYVYEFAMPNVKINDYPKFSVWPDGYYMSTDEFLGSDYVGSGAFAFDREKMLAGDPDAGYIYFNLPQAPAERVGGILPADLDGLTPPPSGSPNVFVGYSATEYGQSADAIRLYEFHADFTSPENSSFNERSDSPIEVASFDPTSPAGRNDIAQPPPGETLDSVSDRLMYRIAYRNFGTHESLVFNQTVRMTPQSDPYRAGVRLYELKRAANGAYAVSTQTTIGDSSVSRWLGAAAQDNQGNLAVGYSVSSEDKRPSIVYSGRSVSDPAGMARSEVSLVDGTGVQRAFGFRWGDYSSMSVDPADDCTFWIANEYFSLESQQFSDFAWLTKVGKFKFPECTPAPGASLSGVVTNAQTGEPIANAEIKLSAYSRMSAQTGNYGPLMAIPGVYAAKARARGYREANANVTLANGQALVQNFALEPIPVIESTQINITAESCVPDHAAEPGERVTIDISLRNTGVMTAGSLTLTLIPQGGIDQPSAPQNYGNVGVNGAPVTRPFSFTVGSNVNCGSELMLKFEMTANGQSIGLLGLPMRAGQIRYALAQNFESSRLRLPQGWTTTASGAQSVWSLSTIRSTSPRTSLFSPDPNQVGLNEAVSPSFHITSPQAELTFRNWYELETTFLRNRLFDGSVLEISFDNGAWQDIVAAGGHFSGGGYDGVIDACCENPLGGRMGWSGRSGINQTAEFITSKVRLPASAAGHDVRLRWRVGTDVGTFREGQYIDDVVVTDGYSCSCSVTKRKPLFDFDGDGKTDSSVHRPNDTANSPDFVVQNSSNGSLTAASWGSVGDIAVNEDFDGDSKTDIAVFRPGQGVWYILRSSDSAAAYASFGMSGDRPVPGDYDGDGMADVAVYRPGEGNWYLLFSSSSQHAVHRFGTNEDVPAVGDYDGDGRADIAVFRPSSGVWYVLRSSDGGAAITHFGQNGDKPAVGDFDGDGKTDLVVYRPSEGVWYLLRSKPGFAAVRFGLPDDIPLQADFDGDGQNDIAVFRPSTREWYWIRSTDGQALSFVFGAAGDTPVPSVYTSH